MHRPEEELYDVVKDSFQLVNLAADPILKKIKDQLKAELKTFMKQQGDNGIATEMDAKNRQPKTLEND